MQLRQGDELKLVYPQSGAAPEHFAGLQFRHFLLQPMDGPDAAPQHCAGDRILPGAPRNGAFSVQTHKVLGLR